MIVLRNKLFASPEVSQSGPRSGKKPTQQGSSSNGVAGNETEKLVQENEKFTADKIKGVARSVNTSQDPENLAMSMYSSREKVPEDIAEKGRKSGVIQKDRKGSWRIISYKQNPPEFWDAHYKSKESAEKGLRGYQANK